jgi:hypothetical protein
MASTSGQAAATIQKVTRGFLARSKFNVNTSTYLARRRAYQSANVVTVPFTGQNYDVKRDKHQGPWASHLSGIREEGGCIRPPREAERVARNFRSGPFPKKPPLCFNMVAREYSVESDGKNWHVDMEKTITDANERAKKPASIVEAMIADTMKGNAGIHRHLTDDVDTEKVGEIFRAAIKSVSEKGNYKLANPHSTMIRAHNLPVLATTFLKFQYYTGETIPPMAAAPMVCRVSPIEPPVNPMLPRQGSRSVYAGKYHREKTPREKLAEAKAELARLQAEKKQRDDIEAKFERLCGM